MTNIYINFVIISVAFTYGCIFVGALLDKNKNLKTQIIKTNFTLLVLSFSITAYSISQQDMEIENQEKNFKTYLSEVHGKNYVVDYNWYSLFSHLDSDEILSGNSSKVIKRAQNQKSRDTIYKFIVAYFFAGILAVLLNILWTYKYPTYLYIIVILLYGGFLFRETPVAVSIEQYRYNYADYKIKYDSWAINQAIKNYELMLLDPVLDEKRRQKIEHDIENLKELYSQHKQLEDSFK